MDSVDHIIVNDHFAVNVWKFFATVCGVDHSNIPFPHYSMRWWNMKYKNEAHRMLLHIVPNFVCWKLWRNRSGCKYGGKQSNLARVKYLVIKHVILLLRNVFLEVYCPENWNELVFHCEKCTHELELFLYIDANLLDTGLK